MGLTSSISAFLRDESGSAVIDWAILSLGLIVAGNLIFEDVAAATLDIADGISLQLFNMEIPKTFADYNAIR